MAAAGRCAAGSATTILTARMSGSIGVHPKAHLPAAAAPSPRPAIPAPPPAAPATKSLPEQILAFVDVRRRWLLIGVLALYLLGFNGQWRLEPDSALYLTIGRNLAEGRGYTYHGVSHHLAYP